MNFILLVAVEWIRDTSNPMSIYIVCSCTSLFSEQSSVASQNSSERLRDSGRLPKEYMVFVHAKTKSFVPHPAPPRPRR